jgi:uncharacterized integral membrane protein
MDDQHAPNDPTARTPISPVDQMAPPPVAPAPVGPPPGTPWPAKRHRRDDAPWASIITGLILVGIGLWFFAEHTLGIDMPRIRWSQMWPLILIAIGFIVLLGAVRGTRR